MFEPLSSVIRLHREKHALTIDALSVLAGVSRTRLIALEKGSDNISLDILLKIANALQITDLPIGGLRTYATTPDINVAVAAADVMHTAQRVLEQAEKALELARTALADLDRIRGPVADLIAPVLEPRENIPPLPEGTPRPSRARKAGGRR